MEGFRQLSAQRRITGLMWKRLSPLRDVAYRARKASGEVVSDSFRRRRAQHLGVAHMLWLDHKDVVSSSVDDLPNGLNDNMPTSYGRVRRSATRCVDRSRADDASVIRPTKNIFIDGGLPRGRSTTQQKSGATYLRPRGRKFALLPPFKRARFESPSRIGQRVKGGLSRAKREGKTLGRPLLIVDS